MEYNDQVRELLESYHVKIESDVMPELANEFVKFYSGVAELSSKLKNKGILKEDPYFKPSEVMGITIPDSDSFPDSDAQWKVAERITQFESVLSYISHNYNFSLNSFNFDELEKLKKFLDYYNWKDLLNPSSTHLNTRTFGKIAINYRSSSSDSLVLSTFDKCVESIVSSVDAIIIKLRFILLYLKESYKQFIRVDLLPLVQEKHPGIGESKIADSIMLEIKDNYSYLKLYKKYIMAVIKEEFFDEGKNLKENIITSLTLTKEIETKNNKDALVDLDKELYTLLLEIGKIRIHLSAAIDKLHENHISLIGNQGNFITKILKKIASLLFGNNRKTIYSITIKRKNNGNNLQAIHYENFYADVKKLEFELLNFTEEDKTIFYAKKNENSIHHIIDKLLISIKKQATILMGLDEYLKDELKNKKLKAKGIKPELTVIKSIINSSTGLYRDYLEKVDKK